MTVGELRKAIALLPIDGSWTTRPVSRSRAIHALWKRDRRTVDNEFFGTDGPDVMVRYRLTQAGIDLARSVIK